MPPRGKRSESLGLEASLWETANRLRSSMDAAEYKHVVLGLIFLKYVSDVFEARRRTLVSWLSTIPARTTTCRPRRARAVVLEDRDEYTAEGVFWVPEGHRWARPAQGGEAARHRRPDRRGDGRHREGEPHPARACCRRTTPAANSPPQPSAGSSTPSPATTCRGREHQSLDVLGRVYEYFLGQFASAEGKLGGEFYTPRSVVHLLVEMLEPYNGRVYDPACGSGGMFVQADEFVEAHGGARNDISVFGQEQNPTTWRLAKMNLALRGIDANLGPQWGDSFHDDMHPDLRADFILANPPFNICRLGRRPTSATTRAGSTAPRPAGNANFAWMQHMLHHLAPTGTMATVLANGSLSSQQSGEGEIRQNLVEADLVECIVALPGQLFYTTQIPVCLWFLTKDKTDRTVEERTLRNATVTARCCSSTPASSAHMVSRTHKSFTDDDIAGSPTPTTPGAANPTTADYQTSRASARPSPSTPSANTTTSSPPEGTSAARPLEDDGEPLDEKIARLTAETREGFEERAQTSKRGSCRAGVIVGDR